MVYKWITNGLQMDYKWITKVYNGLQRGIAKKRNCVFFSKRTDVALFFQGVRRAGSNLEQAAAKKNDGVLEKN